MSNDSSSDSDPESEGTSLDSSNYSPTWIDAMEDLFDTAVDRQAEIECEVNDMELKIPLQPGPDPDYAKWKVNGTVQFRFDGIGDPLAEWSRLQKSREPSDEQPTDSVQD